MSSASASAGTGASANDAAIRIAVRNEGVGIAQSDRRRIFEKFHRGSGDITREVKGAGIGLNLVQHIVRARRTGHRRE